jgi:hypothetical protein
MQKAETLALGLVKPGAGLVAPLAGWSLLHIIAPLHQNSTIFYWNIRDETNWPHEPYKVLGSHWLQCLAWVPEKAVLHEQHKL